MEDLRSKARARGVAKMPAPPSFTSGVHVGDWIQGEVVDMKQAIIGYEGREPNWCLEVDATDGIVKGEKAEPQQFVWSGQRHMGYLIRMKRPCIGDTIYIECVADDPKEGFKYLMAVEKTHKSVRYIGPPLGPGEMSDEALPVHDASSPADPSFDEAPTTDQGGLAPSDDDEGVRF